jgi:hypothetical protein
MTERCSEDPHSFAVFTLTFRTRLNDRYVTYDGWAHILAHATQCSARCRQTHQLVLGQDVLRKKLLVVVHFDDSTECSSREKHCNIVVGTGV